MTWWATNLPKEKHCFFDANGGVSVGFYKGLNVNTKSDDDKTHLKANLQKAAQYFGLDYKNLHLLNQGVSADVVYVAEPTQDIVFADGAVTDKKNVILCIRTADCAPVLLADYQNGIIGAAHAGWRGAYKGVIENTVKLMLEKGAQAENIVAAVGPCIAQESYEVDKTFYDTIGQDKYFIAGREGHWYFDLEAYCVDKLKACGVKNIVASGIDTYDENNGFYSFRRYSHQNLIKKAKCFPAEMSAIVL